MRGDCSSVVLVISERAPSFGVHLFLFDNLIHWLPKCSLLGLIRILIQTVCLFTTVCCHGSCINSIMHVACYTAIIFNPWLEVFIVRSISSWKEKRSGTSKIRRGKPLGKGHCCCQSKQLRDKSTIIDHLYPTTLHNCKFSRPILLQSFAEL